MFQDFWIILITYFPRLLRGAVETIRITIMGISIGIVIGILVGIIRAYKIPIVHQIFQCYVDLIRGTPLLVQVFFIFFGLPSIIDRPIPALLAGVSAIAINSGAYFSEIIRGALLSVSSGQMEAAQSLGLSRLQAIYHIIGPQAFLIALPSLSNQFIISLKDTSLLAVISIEELTRNGQIIIAATFRSFQIWVLVGMIYLSLTSIFAVIFRRMETRLRTH
ncbi:amino acid ABC transporter permease [Candidatus Dojkabacteria bacterium]|nr:amino acid ABC transporter permease [Candidatus Dojkabacteria bacterium]